MFVRYRQVAKQLKILRVSPALNRDGFAEIEVIALHHINYCIYSILCVHIAYTALDNNTAWSFSVILTKIFIESKFKLCKRNDLILPLNT